MAEESMTLIEPRITDQPRLLDLYSEGADDRPLDNRAISDT